jgi:hypothetical protein
MPSPSLAAGQKGVSVEHRGGERRKGAVLLEVVG